MSYQPLTDEEVRDLKKKMEEIIERVKTDREYAKDLLAQIGIGDHLRDRTFTLCSCGGYFNPYGYTLRLRCNRCGKERSKYDRY